MSWPLQELLAIVKALDNESRLRILLSLRAGEVCLCHLSEMLGLAPSTVSRHIELLRRAGLVEMRKAGRWHHYRLAGRTATPPVREALRWVCRAVEHDDTIVADVAKLASICAASTGEDIECNSQS